MANQNKPRPSRWTARVLAVRANCESRFNLITTTDPKARSILFRVSFFFFFFFFFLEENLRLKKKTSLFFFFLLCAKEYKTPIVTRIFTNYRPERNPKDCHSLPYVRNSNMAFEHVSEKVLSCFEYATLGLHLGFSNCQKDTKLQRSSITPIFASNLKWHWTLNNYLDRRNKLLSEGISVWKERAKGQKYREINSVIAWKLSRNSLQFQRQLGANNDTQESDNHHCFLHPSKKTLRSRKHLKGFKRRESICMLSTYLFTFILCEDAGRM